MGNRLVSIALAFWIGLFDAGAAHANVAPTTPAVATIGALLDAHTAWRDRDLARLNLLAPQLRSHLLAPYVEYWQTMLAPEDRQIQRFLERHRGTQLAERLRADWLRGVARRGDWALLAAAYPALEQPPTDVMCWSLRARVALGDRSVADDLLRTQWLQWRELPEGCAAAARELARDGRIAPQAIWSRARALVGLSELAAARRTLDLLPAREAPLRAQLDLALGVPERLLARNAAPRTAVERELAMFALARIAAADPQRAGLNLDLQVVKLPADQRAWAYAQAGLTAARRLQGEALGWFAKAHGADLTDEHCAWWARAALRAEAWPEVRAAIAHMTRAAQDEPRWQYWHARAWRDEGDTRTAKALFGRAARDPGFYGQLALEALPPAAPAVTAAPSSAEIDAVARDPAIARAVALHRADLPELASREWAWAVRHFDDRRLAAASRHAHRLGLWNRGIDSSERTASAHDLGTRYPTPFQALVRPAAKQFDVDAALVYSVMHQESRFAPGNASRAGARGLMQVMPATGQWLAGQLGWQGYATGWLDEPQRNVMLGARYLRQLRTDLGGSTVQVVAGYNAGPGRAVAWRGSRPLEGAIYAESIPLDETREYVKRVMTASLHYDRLLSGAQQPLGERLGMVVPARAPPPVLVLVPVPAALRGGR
jgi:soluble lytic murein transglycosylase